MRLESLPPAYVPTREALHQVAFFAVAPARYLVESRMGLIAAPGGFGTPKFDGTVARVEGSTLVLENASGVASQEITTVRAACEFFGHDYEVDWYTGFRDPLRPVDPDQQLKVDDEAARAVGRWFDFVTDILERLRAHGLEDDDVSDVQLWPEHFDPAIEMGRQDRGRRASYGGSPGDPAHPHPYFYVSAWGDIDRSNVYWNDDAFNGSSLGFAELALVDDPVQTVLDFLLRGYGILHSD